jgi:type IV secretory pathway TrbD component
VEALKAVLVVMDVVVVIYLLAFFGLNFWFVGAHSAKERPGTYGSYLYANGICA